MAVFHSRATGGKWEEPSPRLHVCESQTQKSYALTAMAPRDANCDNMMLFLGKHSPDIDLVCHWAGSTIADAGSAPVQVCKGAAKVRAWVPRLNLGRPFFYSTAPKAGIGANRIRTGFDSMWLDSLFGKQILSNVYVYPTHKKKQSVPPHPHNPRTLSPCH